MIQLIRDALHERAIARQAKVFSKTHGAAARREWTKLEKLIHSRSPEQVARMERATFEAMDPHAQRTFLDGGGIVPKSAIKRTVMGLFFRRLVPQWAVRLAFRVFGLRGA